MSELLLHTTDMSGQFLFDNTGYIHIHHILDLGYTVSHTLLLEAEGIELVSNVST